MFLRWHLRTLNIFKFVQEFEFKPVMAIRNKLLVVGLPEPIFWTADNDNEAKK